MLTTKQESSRFNDSQVQQDTMVVESATPKVQDQAITAGITFIKLQTILGSSCKNLHRFGWVMRNDEILATYLACEPEDVVIGDNLKFYKLRTIFCDAFEGLSQVAGFVVRHNTVVALFSECELLDDSISLRNFVISHVFNPELLGDIAGFWMIDDVAVASYGHSNFANPNTSGFSCGAALDSTTDENLE